MATTGAGDKHRHKTSAGRWYDWDDWRSGSTHTHPVPALDELAARVAALEAALVTPPPVVVPPPVVNPPPVVVNPPPGPVVTPVPPPSPASWSTAFGTRPLSDPIRLNGVTGRVIEGLMFRHVPQFHCALILENCHDIDLNWLDFDDIGGCIFALSCTNIRILGPRFNKITGPYTRTGSPHGNFVQLDKTTGGYIRNAKGIGGNTEDLISMFKSGGTQADPFLIEDVHMDGAGWTSEWGSGIMLGDGGGSFVTVRRVKLLNPGQVGIGIVGGTGHQILDSVLKGEARPGSNVGLSAFNGTAVPSVGHRWAGNKVDWKKASGSNSDQWIYNNGGDIAVAPKSVTVEVAPDNDFTTPIDPASLRVVL